MLVTVPNIRECKLVSEGLNVLLVWRLEDKETKPIYLFPGLCVCGDRVSVPLTSLKNMPGESILP